jgi:membrane protease YdiL (CAAX protease family)
MVFTSNAPSKEIPGHQFLRLALSGEAGLLLLAWGLSRWLDVAPFAFLHPDGPGLIWGLAATVPLLLALAWMLNAKSEPVRQLVALVLEQFGPLIARQSGAALAALAVAAGLSEEVLFRGVIQSGLVRWCSPGVALIITSLLFGLIHFASRSYAVFAAVMGLYLGALFQLAGNLFAPVVTHATYDFAALLWVARRYR